MSDENIEELDDADKKLIEAELEPRSIKGLTEESGIQDHEELREREKRLAEEGYLEKYTDSKFFTRYRPTDKGLAEIKSDLESSTDNYDFEDYITYLQGDDTALDGATKKYVNDRINDMLEEHGQDRNSFNLELSGEIAELLYNEAHRT